ncbi:MAG: MOSC domain-containing protein [Chloroflexi bacterium]|nr:MAG: MOSC domain-containing protein [Chloroflexota bacterium]
MGPFSRCRWVHHTGTALRTRRIQRSVPGKRRSSARRAYNHAGSTPRTSKATRRPIRRITANSARRCFCTQLRITPLWQAELGLPEIGPGGFGENFTVDGLTEENACIGDIYAIGEAQIQVTGPRYPCWKIERRWGIEGLTARVAETGRTGWYCRVVQEGMVEPGMFVTLIERPYPEWTVALTNDFSHSRNKDVERAEALAACPLLHEFWQQLVVRCAMRKKK